MSAAAAIKGILISLAVIAAVSVAVLESPQVQAWLDEQRRKIADLLRSIGEELDPASRRAAEAFAFEGRTPATDGGLRREVTGSQDAAAVATGRSLSNAGLDGMSRSRVYNIPVRGPADPAEAEERKKKGKEYLAKRNQQMIELRQRRKSTQETDNPASPTAISFDEMIDAEGRLRSLGKDRELPSPPTAEPMSDNLTNTVEALNEPSLQPLLVDASSSSSSAWQLGSQLANPFGDEYALDRCETPKPPRPPKIELEAPAGLNMVSSVDRQLPGSFSPQPLGERLSEWTTDQNDLSFEEQLAIALSLSEAENKSQQSSYAEHDESMEDAALQAAINASLQEMEERQAHHQASWSFEQEPQQLIDIESADSSQDVAANTQTAFSNAAQPHQYSLSSFTCGKAPASDCGTDELYHISPQPTAARLVNFEALQQSSPMFPSDLSTRISPINIATLPDNEQTLLDRPLEIAPATVVASTLVNQPNVTTSNTDLAGEEHLSRERTPTPTSRSVASRSWDDSDGESDVFASVHEGTSRSASRARSEISNVEVIDVGEDSDIDVLSEGGYSIATPDSWTEVGSQDGDSDMDDVAPHWTQQAQAGGS